MKLRWGSWLAIMALTSACPGDPTTPGATGSTTGASASATTSGNVPGSGNTTEFADSTTAVSDGTTGLNPTDGASTTGEPPGRGRIQLLLRTGGRLGAGFENLSVYVYDAGQVSDTPVHRALRAQRRLVGSGLSTASSYVWYRTADRASDDDRSFLASYTDGQTGAPQRFNTPPAPEPGLAGNPSFSDDDSVVAFLGRATAGAASSAFVVGTSGGDPVRLHPAPGPGDGVSQLAVGPGNAGIALAGDFTGGGLDNLYLASSDPDLAGDVMLLSQHNDPAQSITSSSIAWLPDGSAVVYRADADVDGLNELWWAGTQGPPQTAVKINGPLAAEQSLASVRVSPDSRAVVYRVSSPIGGDVYLSYIDGALPSAPILLSTPTPNAAFGNSLIWSASGDALIYTAEHNTPGNRDAYYIDMSGALPAAPERINAELVAGGLVQSVVFGPDDGFLYYVAPGNQAGADLYRVPVVEAVPGVPERISGPTGDGGLTGELTFAPDGASVLYTANADDPDQLDLYRLLLDTPLMHTKVNAALEPGFDVRFGASISADGSMVAYLVQQQGADAFTLLLEDLTDELGNPITVSTDAQGYRLLPPR